MAIDGQAWISQTAAFCQPCQSMKVHHSNYGSIMGVQKRNASIIGKTSVVISKCLPLHLVKSTKELEYIKT